MLNSLKTTLQQVKSKVKSQSVPEVCPEYHHLVDISIHYHCSENIFLIGQQKTMPYIVQIMRTE